jgi:hypothetical protein
MAKKKSILLFLDSGAFSAFKKDAVIDIYEYIDFIKDHINEIDVYANLDVIGNAEDTWRNQMIMEKEGLDPLPVYHSMFEPISWLRKYIDAGYKYIGMGGIAGTGFKTEALVQVLDKCFEMICDTPDRKPCVKIHGFGMTSLSMMVRYPWYSVDSTSWVQTGRFGSVYVPRKKNGKFVYDDNTWKISVSNQSNSQQDAGQHFNTLTNMEKKIIQEYFDSKGFIMGKSEFREEDRKTYKLLPGEKWANSDDADGCRELIENLGKYVPSEKLAMQDRVEIVIEEGLSNSYKMRDELNIIYFLDLEKNLSAWPQPWESRQNKGLGF